MTTDDLYDALYYLRANNNLSRVYGAVLGPAQVNNLQESIRSEVGPQQYTPSAQTAVQMNGRSQQAAEAFNFMGVSVRLTPKVPQVNGNADFEGCIFAPGAFAFTLGDVSSILGAQMINPADIIAATSLMYIERDRDAVNSISSFLAKAYIGVAEAEDLRAVKVTTSV